MFPLYETINKKIDQEGCKQLSDADKKSFLKFIKKLNKNKDTRGLELVFVLVKVHSVLENNGAGSLPYGGKYFGKNIRFDLETFPPLLKQILHEFSKMHADI